MKKYNLWLHSAPHTGDASIKKLLQHYECAGEIYELISLSVKRGKELSDDFIKTVFDQQKLSDIMDFTRRYKINETYDSMIDKGIEMYTNEDSAYPTRLKDISPSPFAIYCKGKLPENDIPSVAIIGARDCSPYGTYVADAFGKALASSGVNIISGMARGIDGISQRGAFAVNGSTYAVLGSGVDVCYPEGNYKLYLDIQRKGGIISTFPPGTKPAKNLFPQRNKIVAALSDLVLVVEARVKSGTSITVDLALKLNKEVYAVPGRLTDRLSDGCNKLIRDGAGIALSPEDILKEIAILGNFRIGNNTFNQKDTTFISEDGIKYKHKILNYLENDPLTLDEIHRRRIKDEPDATIQNTTSELLALCIDGAIIQLGAGCFCLPLN